MGMKLCCLTKPEAKLILLEVSPVNTETGRRHPIDVMKCQRLENSPEKGGGWRKYCVAIES